MRYYLIEGPINQVDKKTEGGEAGRGLLGQWQHAGKHTGHNGRLISCHGVFLEDEQPGQQQHQ